MRYIHVGADVVSDDVNFVCELRTYSQACLKELEEEKERAVAEQRQPRKVESRF